MLPRLVHLWKDRLTASGGQPAFWALGKSGGQGSLEKGKGLVLGEAKSEAGVPIIGLVVVPGGDSERSNRLYPPIPWLARTCLTIRRNPVTQPFARRLRNILIRERLNPADVARCLGGGHKDEVAVSNTRSPDATNRTCGIC